MKYIQLLKKFEGLSLKPYLCSAGVPSISYGTTRYPNGTPVKMTDTPITNQQAEALLMITLEKYVNAVNKAVKVKISENMQAALISICYNIGIGAFTASTLLKKVNANPNDLTIAAEFLKWNKANNKVVKGLTTRRGEEAKFYYS